LSQITNSTHTETIIGWTDKPKDDPAVIRLREHIEVHNGIKGLEIIQPAEIERAVRVFRRDGFVVIGDILNNEQIDWLAAGCADVTKEILALDPDNKGNRGSQRYSFGGCSLTRSQLHRAEWQMLLEIPHVHTLVTAIFGSPDYMLRAASGDFCLPGTIDYQPLHSDTSDWTEDAVRRFFSFSDPRGQLTVRDLPCPYIAVNFLPQDVTQLNGPTRQIPGTQNVRTPIPSLAEEPEWMRLSTVCPAPAGSIMIRDVRAWHGGTPNLSDATRSIPNLEFYAPWYREPTVPCITHQDFKKLSALAQNAVRFLVADSSEELLTGPTFRTIGGK